MEKIIYNSKLNKILAGLLVFIILTTVAMPVLATPTTELARVLDEEDFYWKNTDSGNGEKYVPSSESPQEGWNLSTYTLSQNYINTILSLYQPGPDKYNVNTAMYTPVKNAYETYNTNLGKYHGEGKTLEEAATTAAKDALGIVDEAATEVEEVENQTMADVGGILLSPVFYLVNFIADAIMSNLGRIMTGEGSITGIDILVSSPVQIDGVQTSDFNVEMPNVIGTIQYPNIKYTPEEIFSGKSDLLSIDFISGKNAEGELIDGDWQTIRSVIASWYKILRMIAIIGLLSVLIYTGVKIIISANAKDKAKYKEWIINWFVAVAILFSMHYIMSFIISIIGEINKLLGNAAQWINVVPTQGEPFVTNLMGLVRFMIQAEDFGIKIGYEVMYIALVVYTLKFTVIYLKRVLNMAFLTLIAPIVALTYPIDKLNDGNAQGFNMWLKEYIFNALLQPMHFIMYYILVGSAVSIAAANPIYGIVVLMFMTEAEKLLKKIFGFDKAGGGTVGGMAGAFAAGALASSVKDIARMAKLPGGNGKKDGSGGGKDNGIDAPKPTEKPGMDEFLNDGDGQGGLLGDGGNGDSGDNEPKTDQQEMLDAYDDNYGTDEWDAAERDAMAREAYADDGGMDYSEDEYRQILMDSGYEGEDLENAMREGGYGGSSSGLGDDEGASMQPDQNQTTANNNSSDDRMQNFKRGAGAVGKRLLKPAWDLDKSKSYNFKRLAKGGLRAAAGATIGTAAAAVQAGISITDGKYNPMEGMATFAAGYAGAGRLAKGVGSLYDTYKEGTLPTDAKARKEEVMRRAKASFGDRDDVIAFNKKNYPGQEKEVMQRQRDNYLTKGVTDLKEMKSGMKYADVLVAKGLTQKQADTRAAATIDFKKTLQSQGQSSAVYDKGKQEKYIKMMVDKAQGADNKAKVRKQYENAFKAVAAYDEANK